MTLEEIAEAPYSGKRVRSSSQKLAYTTQTLVVVLTAILVALPLFPILYQSFVMEPLYSDRLTFTLSNFVRLLRSEEIRDVVVTTFLFSFSLAITSTIMGAVTAVLTARTNMWGARALGPIFLIPMYTSSMVLAFAWITVYGPGGYMTVLFRTMFGADLWNIYSFGGMVLIGSAAYAPISYLYCLSALSLADTSYEQAAQICGANKVTVLWRITIPLLRPALLYAFLMNVVTGIELLSIPLILGEPVGIKTFAAYLYDQISRAEPEYGLVACASVFILIVMVLLMILQRRLMGDLKRFVTVKGKAKASKRLELGPLRLAVTFLCWIIVLFLVLLPLAGLLMRSFTVVLSPMVSPFSVLTLDNFRFIFASETYSRSIINSILIAGIGGFVAACFALAVVLVSERSDHPLAKPLRFLALFPHAVPGVIVGIGLLWAVILIPGAHWFRLTLVGLGIAFTVRYLPLAVGAISPALSAIGTEQDRAARTSGASWLSTVAYILSPLVRQSFIGAYIILFLSFLREYSAAVFLYVPGTEVIGTTLLSLWVQGETGPVAALASIQIFIVFIVVLVSRYLLGVGIKASAANES